MHRLSGLALALLLGACAARAPEPAFRAPGAPIYSLAVLDPARLAGRWRQVAGYGAASCKGGGGEITPGRGVLQAALRICGAEGARGALVRSGPGRFRLEGAEGALAQEWWVLWADADNRTLVIGTPSGRFGFVLNREGAFPADRLAAVREILDFNGYDPALLQVYPR